MKERLTEEIRGRISPNMTPLFDIVLSAYKKERVRPDFQGVLEESGEVSGLLFNNVPRKVMSRIFDKFMEIKGKETCGFSLEASIKSEDEDFIYSVQLTKNNP